MFLNKVSPHFGLICSLFENSPGKRLFPLEIVSHSHVSPVTAWLTVNGWEPPSLCSQPASGNSPVKASWLVTKASILKADCELSSVLSTFHRHFVNVCMLGTFSAMEIHAQRDMEQIRHRSADVRVAQPQDGRALYAAHCCRTTECLQCVRNTINTVKRMSE